MDIRITQDITFPTDPKSKSPSDYTTFEKGFEAMVNEFCYGAAVLQSGDGGVYLVPSSRFEFIQKSKERTYTEAEMKKMRSGWESKWIELQNEVDSWKEIAREEGSNKIDRERALGDLKDEYSKLETELDKLRTRTVIGEEGSKLWLSTAKRFEAESNAKQAKLDLLETEIKRIESAVNRVVPDDKEGYLADHVEAIVEDHLHKTEVISTLKETVQAFSDALEKKNRTPIGIVAEGEKKGRIVFTSAEENHPEDQYVEQQGAAPDSFQEYFEAVGENLRKAFEKVGAAVTELKEHNEAKAAGGQVYRDWIVAQAKKHVSSRDSVTFGSKVQFFRKDRRVTCVITSTFERTGATVRMVGRANCDPDDCFNIHIGRAIALMRAQGMTVPPIFFEVPEPTEVRVGDVVDVHGGIAKVNAIRPTHSKFGHEYSASEQGLTHINEKGYETWDYIEDCRIIDDSREEN